MKLPCWLVGHKWKPRDWLIHPLTFSERQGIKKPWMALCPNCDKTK